jgi:transcription elongation GreA/GreB family factor
MTEHEKIAFKNELKQLCQVIIEQRIAALRFAINAAQQAANNEEKSSAGDKYETSRAMSHLEKDMHTRQLSENVKELATLFSVNINAVYDEGVAGAFLQCTGVSFFIAAGLGKQTVAGNCIFLLSPHAPLAKLLQSKRAGDAFIFNSVETHIEEVY